MPEETKKLTVVEIRRVIWDRQEGVCARCPNLVTWRQAHLHERISRGKGGKISLDNSEILCYNCHLGSRGVHPNRQLNFTKSTERFQWADREKISEDKDSEN